MDSHDQPGESIADGRVDMPISQAVTIDSMQRDQVEEGIHVLDYLETFSKQISSNDGQHSFQNMTTIATVDPASLGITLNASNMGLGQSIQLQSIDGTSQPALVIHPDSVHQSGNQTITLMMIDSQTGAQQLQNMQGIQLIPVDGSMNNQQLQIVPSGEMTSGSVVTAKPVHKMAALPRPSLKMTRTRTRAQRAAAMMAEDIQKSKSTNPEIYEFPEEDMGADEGQVNLDKNGVIVYENDKGAVDDEDDTISEQDEREDDPKTEAKSRKGARYDVYQQIQSDIQNVTHSQVYQCEICQNYAALSQETLEKHLRSHYRDRPHKCPNCDKGFRFLSLLQQHMHIHTGNKPNKCDHCPQAFVTRGELTRHIRYRHTLYKPHKCPEPGCEYASVEVSKLRRHIRSHTGDRPFKCPECSYCCADNFKLKRHLKTHTGEKPYECPVCHARFTQNGSMKQHLLGHTGNKERYQCEYCDTTCGRKSDLKQHMLKLHTSAVPLKCKYCLQPFSDRHTLLIHLREHKGEKHWKCDLCDYECGQQRHMTSHRRVHTGEKPHICPDCSLSFRVKQQLREHVVKIHGSEEDRLVFKQRLACRCPTCDKILSSKSALKHHMMSFHGQHLPGGRRKKDDAIWAIPAITVTKCVQTDPSPEFSLSLKEATLLPLSEDEPKLVPHLQDSGTSMAANICEFVQGVTGTAADQQLLEVPPRGNLMFIQE